MRKRIVFITIVVTLGVLTVGGAVLGATDGGRDRAARVARITGTSGKPCGMGFDTQTLTNIPPDDSTSDNTPAATVTLKKTCPGAVIGHFTSEVATPASGDFLHLDMRATCVGAAGLANPCTPGLQVFASPGHSFFQSGQASTHVGAINMVWDGLARGRWRFEVLPGGSSSANLQFRSFVVEAFAG